MLKLIPVTIAFIAIVAVSCVYAQDDKEEKWSECNFYMKGSDAVCRQEFSDEWEFTGQYRQDECGLFYRQVLCRHSYPGCKATKCTLTIIPKEAWCKRDFGTELPVMKGGFKDCFFGFERARCCPSSYEKDDI